MTNEEIIAELRTYPPPERVEKLCRILEVNIATERDWHRGGARAATKQIDILQAENRRLQAEIADILRRLRELG